MSGTGRRAGGARRTSRAYSDESGPILLNSYSSSGQRTDISQPLKWNVPDVAWFAFWITGAIIAAGHLIFWALALAAIVARSQPLSVYAWWIVSILMMVLDFAVMVGAIVRYFVPSKDDDPRDKYLRLFKQRLIAYFSMSYVYSLLFFILLERVYDGLRDKPLTATVELLRGFETSRITQTGLADILYIVALASLIFSFPIRVFLGSNAFRVLSEGSISPSATVKTTATATGNLPPSMATSTSTTETV